MAEPMPDRGALRRWCSPERQNLLAFVLLFLVTMPMLTKIFTSDFGTHIAVGREIVQNHHIPTQGALELPVARDGERQRRGMGIRGDPLPGAFRRRGSTASRS